MKKQAPARPPRSALLASSGLAALGMLHAAWALGWRWPGGSDEAWARRIGGTDQLPTAAEIWAMSAALLGAAGAVALATFGQVGGGVRTTARLVSWGTSLALAGRAVYFLPTDLRGDRGVFGRLDLVVYAPCSAALGVAIARSLHQFRRHDGGHERQRLSRDSQKGAPPPTPPHTRKDATP